MNLIVSWTRLDSTERAARCRSLAMAVKLLAGPAGQAAVDALRNAETDDGALIEAERLLDALPSLPYRRALSAFAATLRARP